MSEILKKVHGVDPNNSDAVKDTLTTFFQNLSKHTEVDCNRWLRTLEYVLNRFPKYCTSHHSTIETHLCYFLDSGNYYNVIEAAKCAQAIQQVRPSQDKAASPKTNWREQVAALCNAAHKLIDNMFTKAVNFYKKNNKQKKNEVMSMSPLKTALARITNTENAVDKQTLLDTRLRNIFVFIQAMLVETYPVAKPVQPQLVLEVIIKLLSITSDKVIIRDVYVVKTQALRTLDALIACLGTNLVPFSAVIFRCVMQTLRWSSDNITEENRKVRCTAYNSLSRWLTVLHVHGTATQSKGKCWKDELTTHIINDITPPKKVIELKVNAQPMKHLSKKSKRKLTNKMLQESSISTHAPGEKNKITLSEETSDEVAIAGLDCAETFLNVCGVFLKPATYKSLIEQVIRQCYELIRGSTTLERALRLLCVTRAARACFPPAAPTPAHHCLALYTALLTSRHAEVSRFCSQALLELRLSLHCSPPTINYATEVIQENKKPTAQKRISKKNLDVLESLLGKKFMPWELMQEEEEVITISDEPSNKKPRLSNEITEKISLSSENVSSVEISDDSDIEKEIQEVEVTMEKYTNDETCPEIGEELVNSEEESPGTEENQTVLSNLDNVNGEIDSDRTITRQKSKIASEIKENIHEAPTQLPAKNTYERELSPPSMKVAYDYTGTDKETVQVLGKLEDENLPSTNDTDDVQIACGQEVNKSQDNAEKNIEILEVPKVNGVDKSPEEIEKDSVTPAEDSVTVKIVPNNDVVTVEDMLADFVDEVNDEIKST